MHALSQATEIYITAFKGFMHQFLVWGEWIFFSLLVINIVWLCLWYAFDRHTLTETMPDFIKRFFGIALFYTVMINPSWLFTLLQTVNVMGNTITHAPIDPSSLISQGLGIANQVIIPIEKSSIFTSGFGLLVVVAVYAIILFSFISIALELALTLIMTTALIAVSSFFLGFAALGATSHIARQTLDVILTNCVKLLGIYVVVGAGSQTLIAVTAAIPTHIVSFDAYGWIIAVTLLFWLVAKNLPHQFAKIVSGAIQESRGTDAAALTLSAIQTARMVLPAAAVAGVATGTLAKVAGSMSYNAAMNLAKATGITRNPARMFDAKSPTKRGDKL